MDLLLRRYVYKDYFDLLKDRDFERFLYNNSWIKPAVIPRSWSAKGNRLTRKHLVRGRKDLLADTEFQRLLYRLGFTRYFAVTTTTTSTSTTSTTSTTTTSTTTASPIDPDAQAFITAANITDNTQKGAINTLVVSLKSASIWNSMFAIYPIVGGTASSHKFNLVNPADTDGAFRLSFNGGWTHSATGALPDGSTGYANAHLDGSLLLTSTSGSLGYYSRINNSSAAAVEVGSYNGAGILGVSCRLSDGFYPFYGSLTFGNVPNVNSSGLFCTNRLSSTNTQGFINGSEAFNVADAVSSIPALSLYIAAMNSSNIATNFSSRECAFAFISSGLDNTQQSNLYNIIQTYQTTLGRQV